MPRYVLSSLPEDGQETLPAPYTLELVLLETQTEDKPTPSELAWLYDVDQKDMEFFFEELGHEAFARAIRLGKEPGDTDKLAFILENARKLIPVALAYDLQIPYLEQDMVNAFERGNCFRGSFFTEGTRRKLLANMALQYRSTMEFIGRATDTPEDEMPAYQVVLANQPIARGLAASEGEA